MSPSSESGCAPWGAAGGAGSGAGGRVGERAPPCPECGRFLDPLEEEDEDDGFRSRTFLSLGTSLSSTLDFLASFSPLAMFLAVVPSTLDSSAASESLDFMAGKYWPSIPLPVSSWGRVTWLLAGMRPGLSCVEDHALPTVCRSTVPRFLIVNLTVLCQKYQLSFTIYPFFFPFSSTEQGAERRVTSKI